MLNKDSFIKFMHMAASVRDPCPGPTRGGAAVHRSGAHKPQ